MNNIKPYTVFALIVLLANNVHAQDTLKSKTNNEKFIAIEVEPSFRGSFGEYIGRNLRYPEVAKIVGLTGKVLVQFVIEKNGSVTEVKPVKCLGAGCTSEAVRVISESPNWRPGIQNGKPVRVMYTVPINFNFTNSNTKTTFKSLRKSNYVFVFFIDGQIYKIDEAEQKLGDSFDPATIENVEEYDNPKYAMPNKKGVYMIMMKNS